MPRRTLWLLALCACSTATPDAPRPEADLPVYARLQPGTTVQVRAEGDLGSPTLLPRLRELLAQSAVLDFTADRVSRPGPVVTLRASDPAQGERAWFASLLRPGEPPLPLRGAHAHGGNEDELADALARAIRRSLGEESTDLDATFLASRLSYSPDDHVVATTEQALNAIQDGELVRARGHLEQALRRDAGCAQAGAYLAALLVELGEASRGRELARRLLAVPGRMTPASAHRCVRAALLAEGDDAGLVRLGEDFLRARPYDPQGRLTRALGLALSDRLGEALPVLQELEPRLPHQQTVAFLSAWALIASHQPEAALQHLEQLHGRLPEVILARPRIFALFQLQRWRDIEKQLDQLGASAGQASGSIDLELLVMRGALALIQGDKAVAGDRLLAAVDRLRSTRRKDVDPARALAELGEALVFLDRGAQLRQALRAFDDDPYLRDQLKSALTYLHALLAIGQGVERPTVALQALENSDLRGWQRAVDAAASRQRHELAQELAARNAAARELATPFHRMLLARAAQEAGNLPLASAERQANKALLESVSLRHPERFPIAHPGHALAWLDACGRLP